MRSGQSTMWQEALVYIYFTLMAYTLNKYACHIAHMSYCLTTVGYIQTAHTSKENNTLQFLFTMLLWYMCQQQICPSDAPYIRHAQITKYASIGEVCQYIHATYEFTGTNHMIRSDVDRKTMMQHWQQWWCSPTASASRAVAKNSDLYDSLKTQTKTGRWQFAILWAVIW